MGVHRLVAAAFIGPQPEGYQVAHENGNPSDNRISNLSYKTPKENCLDKIRHGTQFRGEQHPSSKLTDAQSEMIRKEYKRYGWLKSNAKELAEKYNVTTKQILNIVSGRGRSGTSGTKWQKYIKKGPKRMIHKGRSKSLTTCGLENQRVTAKESEVNCKRCLVVLNKKGPTND